MDIISYTDQGARPNNEDKLGYFLDSDKGIFVLADGLGGHDCGETASATAVRTILSAATQTGVYTDEAILDMISGANTAILQQQEENQRYKGMRTTIVVAFVQNAVCRVAHIGDSRFYYFHKGSICYQTKDHSVAQMAVNMEELTENNIRFNDDRNKLLRVLGEKNELSLNKIDHLLDMEVGDAFLLCSDGLWEYVYEMEMEIDLLKSDTAEEWLKFMVKRLLLRVTGNHDNFSLICGIVQDGKGS